jgi:hypothetical protein
MSYYHNKQIPGELWLRDLKDNIDSANNVLSAIYLKYQNISSTFYSELTSNKITRFDTFNDAIFVETPSGCIFEKLYLNDDNFTILPYNQLNLFNFRKNTTVDYWYDENKKKVFFTEIAYYDDPNKVAGSKYFDFIFLFKTFSCQDGILINNISNRIRFSYSSAINWNDYVFFIENPKLTYNTDTKYFNVSFILRNSVKSLGLVSINVINSDTPIVTEVHGFLPYFTIDSTNCGLSAF